MTDGLHVPLRRKAAMRTLDRSRLLPVRLFVSLCSAPAIGSERVSDARCRAWLQRPEPPGTAALAGPRCNGATLA